MRPVDSAQNQNLNVHTRQLAASGNVEYGKPIILHETSKTRVELIPFYIRHSDHTALSVKLATYRKADPPYEWVNAEDATLTLNEEATSILTAELPKLNAIAGEKETGEYITIRVEDGMADIAGIDPGAVTEALLKALSQKDIVSHLSGRKLDVELIKALQYSIRLTEMESAMAELRQMLDGGVTLEANYQSWCELHPWAFGNQFVVKDDIRNLSPQDQVDMLLPRIAAGYRDILELKRPDMDVLKYDRDHRDYFFSRETSMAIGQCHRYLDVFVEVASKGLLGSPEIVAYHPEATIVIGRSKDWDDDETKALHGLNSRLSGIKVITYDYLLAQGDSLVSYLSRTAGDDEPSDADVDESDDVPF